MQGTLQQWDDAYTLYHRPATRFVAEFIPATAYSCPATIRERGHDVVVRAALGDLTDMAECPLPCAFEGQCDLLLRDQTTSCTRQSSHR